MAPLLSSRVGLKERDVWELVAKGLADKEIAFRLDKEVATVKAQLRSIFRKVGCSNRVQLALAWHGLQWKDV